MSSYKKNNCRNTSKSHDWVHVFEPTCAHAWWALLRRLLSVCAKILEKKSLEKNHISGIV